MKVRGLLRGWALAACVVGTPAWAADEGQLRQVSERLAFAAAPWCGKATELQADGRRRCTLPVRLLSTAQPAQAIQFFSAVAVTAGLLRALDADELAAVVGHEIAHFALGHTRVRARQASLSSAMAMSMDAMGADMPEPHQDTPIDGPAQELDADVLGQLFALRAGYAPLAAARLFADAPQRLAGWEDAAAGSATHPPSRQRAQALAARARVHCQRLRAGQPLLAEEARLQPAEDYRREEAAAAPRPPASVCAGAV